GPPRPERPGGRRRGGAGGSGGRRPLHSARGPAAPPSGGPARPYGAGGGPAPGGPAGASYEGARRLHVAGGFHAFRIHRPPVGSGYPQPQLPPLLPGRG